MLQARCRAACVRSEKIQHFSLTELLWNENGLDYIMDVRMKERSCQTHSGSGVWHWKRLQASMLWDAALHCHVG